MEPETLVAKWSAPHSLARSSHLLLPVGHSHDPWELCRDLDNEDLAHQPGNELPQGGRWQKVCVQEGVNQWGGPGWLCTKGGS